MKDETYMRRALELAARGRGKVSPNPMVGCVLVKGGRVVGEGWHARFGGPHAEPRALKAAGARARGATAYVTLEPCMDHPGKKTPACAPALAASGVARVVAASTDPHPPVTGRGLAFLRRAGVRAASGTLAAQAEALNRPFFTRWRLGRPYVVLKSALSLDGRAAARSGRSKWITGPKARALGHAWRARADAILVGVGTVLADDPELTSHGRGPDPVRVILDTRLRTPRGARCLRGERTLIVTASRRSLPGAEMVRVPTRGGRVSLKAALAALAERGILSVLVEGGPTVHAAFLAEGLADEARWFIAPKLLAGADDPNRAPRLAAPVVEKVGDDYLFSGQIHVHRNH